MMPDRPIDLPGNTLADQLRWVARWAGVDHSLLIAREPEIAKVFHKGYRFCVPVLKECLHQTPQMAERVYDKLSSRNMALYRLGQMDSIKHLRPFWQINGECAGLGAGRKTLLSSDQFWESVNVPWNCTSEDCQCRVYSLSRIELKHYVDGGCDAGDESAAYLSALADENKIVNVRADETDLTQ